MTIDIRSSFTTNVNTFTYWEGPKPDYIQLCHETQKRHNENNYGLFHSSCYTCLTPENLREFDCLKPYLDDEFYNSLHPAHRADIVRVKLLETYGGVWIDSDFISMNSFDTLINSSSRHHKLYYYRDSWQATNGILIAPPRHSIVVEWSRKIDCVFANLKRMKKVGNPYDGWCSFGADQLKVVLNVAIDSHQDLGWDRVQLIPYGDMHRYFQTEDQIKDSLRSQVWPGCYGYMLFNTGFPEWFKNLSREEILNGPWVISLLFRLALGLEKF